MRRPGWCVWCRKRIWPWQPAASRRFATGADVTLHASCADSMDRRDREIAADLERRAMTTEDAVGD